MLTLYLLRHAKSSWNEPHLKDFDRPLNKRGKRDAPFMGDVFFRLGIKPDLIVSSPAERAITTARIVAEHIKYSPNKIVRNENIYYAESKKLVQLINELPDEAKKVILVGHNPTFTDTINYLSDYNLSNLPTCSMVGIDFNADSWKEITKNSGRVTLHEFPKKYQ